MSPVFRSLARSPLSLAVAVATVVLIGGGVWWLATAVGDAEATRPAADRAEHEHGEHAHAELASIELSPQARRNIGLETDDVELDEFERLITIPAIVVERPGRTKYKIAAPLTGIVTAVHVMQGEAVKSGELLFTLRLTHQDLVEAQADFLRMLGQLDVEQREIARLQQATGGAIAGRVVLEREYERDKLEAALQAQREALLLHGLSEEHVERISEQRRLLRELKIYAPLLHEDSSLHAPHEEPHETQGAATDEPHARVRQFVVDELLVRTGQAVSAGETLGVLADYSELYIEGQAFEQDADELVTAANAHRHVIAIAEKGEGAQREVVRGLDIVYVANEIDRDTRALHFYVALPNTVVRDAVAENGRHFLTWRFKPGQRMQIGVPVEAYREVIVLPVDAVAQEGAESFVFVENGDLFERRPVHVLYRDQLNAVIANDGMLFPGDTVAVSAAHQLQTALNNQAGGGVDPHHGHTH